MEEGPDLVLASASPRRRELLERIGLRLTVCPAHIDEAPRPAERAADYVRRMAIEKAAAGMALVTRGAGTSDAADTAATAAATTTATTTAAVATKAALLAADTIVIVDGEILGKPNDDDDAARMLRRLAGRRHEVTTAYRILYGGRELDRTVTTVVAFRLLDPAELAAYVAGGEWRGKAGGYAVQGVAAAFVTELRGSLTNVVGLPLAETLADLRALGAVPHYPPARFAAMA